MSLLNPNWRTGAYLRHFRHCLVLASAILALASRVLLPLYEILLRLQQGLALAALYALWSIFRGMLQIRGSAC